MAFLSTKIDDPCFTQHSLLTWRFQW